MWRHTKSEIVGWLSMKSGPAHAWLSRITASARVGLCASRDWPPALRSLAVTVRVTFCAPSVNSDNRQNASTLTVRTSSIAMQNNFRPRLAFDIASMPSMSLVKLPVQARSRQAKAPMQDISSRYQGEMKSGAIRRLKPISLSLRRTEKIIVQRKAGQERCGHRWPR